MKQRLLTAILLCVSPLCLFAQQAAYSEPDGGGVYDVPQSICVTNEQRALIEQQLKYSRIELVSKGILSNDASRKTTMPKLDWPIRQANGFSYFKIYGISNFVDLDANYPNFLTDYNCGKRTYDNNNGYNHSGTDIFLWPFSINMMDDDQAEIVAAAPGTILYKHDGEFDKSCSLNGSTWNAVYIEHTDGSVAWYGHMKKGSLTTKSVGATVSVGEYLGVVGSSGNSTGPHLHFELHDDQGKVVDPYNGVCNNIGSSWNNQKPYYESAINALMTHSIKPDFKTCPTPAVINAKDTFQPNSDVIFAAYYSDQLNTQTSTYSVLRPDNSVEHTWTHNSSAAQYNASWWYWTRKVAATGITGKYTFRVSYEGKNYEHEFFVLNPASTNIISADNKLEIYPNPAKDVLYIKGGTADVVELYDMMGRLVLKAEDVNEQVNVANLSDGVYLLVIRNGDYLQQNKIEIRR